MIENWEEEPMWQCVSAMLLPTHHHNRVVSICMQWSQKKRRCVNRTTSNDKKHWPSFLETLILLTSSPFRMFLVATNSKASPVCIVSPHSLTDWLSHSGCLVPRLLQMISTLACSFEAWLITVLSRPYGDSKRLE
jgi:hypothetical protein